MLAHTRFAPLILVLATLLSGCFWAEGYGGEGQPCFDNKTCAPGHVCDIDICVKRKSSIDGDTTDTESVCERGETGCDGTWTTTCQGGQWVRVFDCLNADKICAGGNCVRDGGDGDEDGDSSDGDTPDGDTDGDTDDDNDEECVCTTGACCDGCAYRTEEYICQKAVSGTAEYRCSSPDCGAKLEVRHQDRACSGESSACDGELRTGDWGPSRECTSIQHCNAGTANCITDRPACDPTYCVYNAGPCCDNATNTLRVNGTVCVSAFETEYGCPDGSGCGVDVKIRYRDRTCTGSGALCDGPEIWRDWEVHDACDLDTEVCTPGQTACTPARPTCDSTWCNAGSCCDLESETILGISHLCETDVPDTQEYRCTSADCGGDLEIRYLDRYCDSSQPTCEGEFEFGSWRLAQDCTAIQFCDAENAACLTDRPTCDDTWCATDSGVCCDNTHNTFFGTEQVCEEKVLVDLGCPDGTGCGDDVATRHKDRYCSGTSSACDGALSPDWSSWTLDTNCANLEACTVTGEGEAECVTDRPTCDITWCGTGSGVCCDNDTNTLRGSDFVCAEDVDFEYGCPDGPDCGADVSIRTRDRVCDAASPACPSSGSFGVWKSWSLADACDDYEVCVPGLAACQLDRPGCDPLWCNVGVCCDTDIETLYGTDQICESLVPGDQYRCTHAGCAGEIEMRYQDRYCNGETTTCEGLFDYSDTWGVVEECGGDQRCHPTTFDCELYVFHDTIDCDGLKRYYYNACEVQEDLIEDCDDRNLCTIDACAPEGCTNTPYTCNGHGTCDGAGGCVCDPGYAGDFCDACADGVVSYPNCDTCNAGAISPFPLCFIPAIGFCEAQQCFPVPPTTQKNCYAWYPPGPFGQADCPGGIPAQCGDAPALPGCGQDAQYPDRMRVFTCLTSAGSAAPCADLSTALDDEVVLDSLTGLMWQRTFASGKTWTQASDYCETLDYADFDDWRLPTPHELRSLVLLGPQDRAIDMDAFPGTPDDWFWGPLGLGPASNSWALALGTLMRIGNTAPHSVRCVRLGRGESLEGSESRFVTRVVSGDDLVTDRVTGLVWEKDARMGGTWPQVLAYCEELQLGGYSDWRLPNYHEMMSLVSYGRVTPASDFPGMTSSYYFTSSSADQDPYVVWSPHYQRGQVTTSIGKDVNSDSYFSRCVRGGPGLFCDDGDPCTYGETYNALGECTDGTPYDCNGYGVCDGNNLCICDEPYAGPFCDECMEGYLDWPTCRDNPCEPDPCYGQGACDLEDGSCSCYHPRMTDNCSSCEEHFENYPNCDWDGTFSDGYCDARSCWPVIPTGQNLCYRWNGSSSTVPCPGGIPAECGDMTPLAGCGQDAQYGDRSRIFIEHSNSGELVLEDSLTGIFWQGDLPETFALCTAGSPGGSKCTWEEALAYCDNLVYGGSDDWRLPRIHELLTLSNYQRAHPATDIPDTPSDSFSSATIFAQNPSLIWSFSTNIGYGLTGQPTSGHFVRCARDQHNETSSETFNPFSLFLLNDDTVVADVVTGLQWQYTTSTYGNWASALAYCESLTYGGYSDWRMPNLYELLSLIDYSRHAPATLFPGSDSHTYWTATTSVNSPSDAWRVEFGTGRFDGEDKSSSYKTRCVRGKTGFPCDDEDPCTHSETYDAEGRCGGGIPYACNGHGECNGNAFCSCGEAYSGDFCDECAEGYLDYPECRPNPCIPDPCNDRGVCDPADGSCTCDHPYDGAFCDECVVGFEDYPNCTSEGFIPLNAGSFWMGSPEGCPAPEGYPGDCTEEVGRSAGEHLHQVTLTYDFEMMRHEVTQSDFTARLSYNPSWFREGGSGAPCGGDCPVEYLTWHETLAYANALSVYRGLPPCFDCTGTLPNVTCSLKTSYPNPQDCPGYRLPTEAEWEYAARAGTYSGYYNAASLYGELVCGEDTNLNPIAWYCSNSENTTHPVGGKTPNPWGFYDISGNAQEFVWDWFGAYTTSPVTDPTGPASALDKVTRGGGFNGIPYTCRNAARGGAETTFKHRRLGFRLVRSLFDE